MTDVNNEGFFEKPPIDPPKILPESSIDHIAIKRAQRRLEQEAKMKELREWFIYQAPPGLYDLFIEERKKLLKREADELRNAKIFAWIVCLIILSFVGDSLHHLYVLETSRP